mgnify:CR=1 FL=1
MAAYDSWRFENLTSRVRTLGAGMRPVQIRRGAGSERDDVQPSTLALALENTDHALTPGNPSSPYAAWWGQRRRCRFVETVLGVDYVRFTGYTNPVDLPDWAEPGVEQVVTLTAVDWFGRLDTAREFTSTLGEHILTAGGPLALHYPLADRALPMMSANAASRLGLEVSTVGAFPALSSVDPSQLVQPGALTGPPGDDQAYPRWLQSLSTDGTTFIGNAVLTDRNISVPVTSGQTIAVSFWAYLEAHQLDPGITPPNSSALWLTTDDHDEQITVGGDPSANLWRATVSVNGGAPTAAASGRQLETDAWRLVTVRYTLPSGAIDLWVGGDMQVTATTPSPPASITFNQIHIGYALWKGSLAQVQVRVGPAASTMTYADHLAQHLHGYRGLERQTAAERVATIAAYAGVPAADLSIDPAATTPMRAARLARARPTALLRTAAATEGGRLFVSGAGQIRLRARTARFRQAVALQIPYAWLLRGLRLQEERPINDVTASSTNGGSTRRTDVASIQRYGVGAAPVTLDTAIDADPGNYADWMVAAYKTPRMRCPQLVIDLLPLTDSQRASLLALEIGDRIELTGGPSTIPPDARHLIVEGFMPDEIGVETRRMTLNTSPLLGPSTGVPPASVMVGDLVSDSAVITY